MADIEPVGVTWPARPVRPAAEEARREPSRRPPPRPRDPPEAPEPPPDRDGRIDEYA